MRVIDFINSSSKTAFSFEVLPPLKGVGTHGLFTNIDRLMEFNPGYINITTHHSEPVYRDMGGGMFSLGTIRRRPGTVAVATAIHHRYGVPVVPHILCNGYTLEDTEYVYLEYDVEQFDQYDRTLAYVWIEEDGEYLMLNEIMLSEGYAEPVLIKPNLKYADYFDDYKD